MSAPKTGRAAGFYPVVNRLIAKVRELRAAAEAGSPPPPEVLDALEGDFDDLILAAGRLDALRGRNLEAVRAQEDERARIAREIHDGPAQLFAGFVRAVEYVQTLLERGAEPSAVRAELETIKADVRRGLAELRRFIFHLRPPALKDLGLAAALRQVADEAARTAGITVGVAADEPDRLHRLPAEVDVSLFRIGQEAIQNAVKHSAARRVEVRIRRRGDRITLEVEDDGKGLGSPPSTAELLERRKLGLIGMRERADLVGGTVAFLSPPGGGTLVRAEMDLTGYPERG